MSEYAGAALHKFHCIYSDLCIFIPGFLILYRFKIYINPTTTAGNPMPTTIPIAVPLLSSTDGTVREEVDNEMHLTSCM